METKELEQGDSLLEELEEKENPGEKGAAPRISERAPN